MDQVDDGTATTSVNGIPSPCRSEVLTEEYLNNVGTNLDAEYSMHRRVIILEGRKPEVPLRARIV